MKPFKPEVTKNELLKQFSKIRLTKSGYNELRKFTDKYCDLLISCKKCIYKCFNKNPIFNVKFYNGLGQNLDSAVEKLIEFYPIIDFNVFLTKLDIHDHHTHIQKLLSNETVFLEDVFNKNINYIIEHCLFTYRQNELKNVESDLKGKSFYNLSNVGIDLHEAEELINHGKNYNPHILPVASKLQSDFKLSIIRITESMIKKDTTLVVNFNPGSFPNDLEQFIYKNPLSQDVLNFLSNIIDNFESRYNSFGNEAVKYNMNKKPSPEFAMPLERLTNAFQIKNHMFLEADKNVGYVLLSNEEILNQYVKINVKQNFVQADIIERDYLQNMETFINLSTSSMPYEIRSWVPSKFLKKYTLPANAEIGIMRLQPKILKLKSLDICNLTQLTSRGIRAATSDPLGIVEKIIHYITKKLFEKLEEEFKNTFNIKPPMVKSTKEFVERFNSEDPHSDGLHFEADVTDLYSRCTYEMVCDSIDFVNKFIKLSGNTIIYIKNLYKKAMQSAYFKEPTGIHRCDDGFAMGSHKSAIASDFILSTHEFNIYTILRKFSKQKFIKRYNRLRDDLTLKICGTQENIADVLHIIFTNYPKGLEFTVTSNAILSKFLDTRIIHSAGHKLDTLTILRKCPNKFDIIKNSSNTNDRYKTSAANHYLNRIANVCNTQIEKHHQLRVTKLILKYKGISLRKRINKRKTSTNIRKAFCNTITHDVQSNSHVIIKSFLKKCKYPKASFYYPTDIPGKKMKSFIFSKDKLVKNLWI